VTIWVVYAIVSVLIGGAAVTYEVCHEPARLDRADGRGTFPSPKLRGGELVFFGLFVALLWPLLALVMAVVEGSEKP
jgi:hypothetical protein